MYGDRKWIQDKYGTLCNGNCVHDKGGWCEMVKYSVHIANRYREKCTSYLRKLKIAPPALSN